MNRRASESQYSRPPIVGAINYMTEVGRAEDLKSKAKGPIQAGVEMANLPTALLLTLTGKTSAVQIPWLPVETATTTRSSEAPSPMRRYLPSAILGLLIATSAHAATFRWIDPREPRVAAVVAAGRATADELVRTLQAEVTRAVAADGLTGAVAACQLKALPLTADVARSAAPAVTAIKRTSPKLRNPANAPDAAEQAALGHIAALLARGAPLPSFLIQELAHPGQPAELRFYRPLVVAQGCVACHGDPATFPAALKTVLATRYPADAATGYHENDWRGLLRVSLAPSS